MPLTPHQPEMRYPSDTPGAGNGKRQNHCAPGSYRRLTQAAFTKKPSRGLGFSL